MLRVLSSLVLFTTAALDAQVSAPEPRQLALPGGEPLAYSVQLPPRFAADAPSPLLVLVGDVPGGMGAAIASAGFVVVRAPAREPQALGALLAELRRDFRIAQVGMHLAGGEAALQLALTHGTEVQTLTLWRSAVPAEVAPLARLRGRRVRLLAGAEALLEPLRAANVDAQVAAASPSDGPALARHFAALHAERALAGAAGEVARTLDDLHDAAARGDATRYFAILPDDAVFLGTDGGERWTGAEFRAFAQPYFDRGSAWTYVPLQRHVTVAAGGGFAWFDERLDNEAYGECRGSGVLERRGERWVVRQYDLAIPVPNELARDFVARIRARAEGR